jgi:hypothetical protein
MQRGMANDAEFLTLIFVKCVQEKTAVTMTCFALQPGSLAGATFDFRDLELSQKECLEL